MRYANITSIPSSYIVAFFSSLVPASALSSWGSMPQLGNTMIREGAHFVFACQGIEPCQANADAGTRRPQVRLRPPGEIALLSIEIVPPRLTYIDSVSVSCHNTSSHDFQLL